MKLLLYCTKSKPYLYKDRGIEYTLSNKKLVDNAFTKFNPLNGKITCKCDFEVEEIYPFYKDFEYEDIFYEIPNNLDFDNLLKKSCLDNQQLDDYLKGKNGYAIHIKNSCIYDEPKEMNEVYSIHNVGGMLLTDKLKKAPQNMQRISIKEWEYGTYNPNDVAILISIHPEWLCKILNGEKIIEVRKRVLKEMLNKEELKV